MWPQEGENRTGRHSGRRHSGRGEGPLGGGRGPTRAKIILGRREMGAGVQLPDPKVTFSKGLGARRALREEGGVVWRLLEEQAGPHLGAGRGSAAHEGQLWSQPWTQSRFCGLPGGLPQSAPAFLHP